MLPRIVERRLGKNVDALLESQEAMEMGLAVLVQLFCYENVDRFSSRRLVDPVVTKVFEDGVEFDASRLWERKEEPLCGDLEPVGTVSRRSGHCESLFRNSRIGPRSGLLILPVGRTLNATPRNIKERDPPEVVGSVDSKMVVKTRSMSRRQNVLRLGARVGGLLAQRMAMKRSFTKTRTQTKSKTRESAPLTYDNDFKTDYRYKRMPRRRRRRWVRFARKVNYVVLRGQQGLKKMLYRRLQTVSSASASCGFTEALLYSSDGNYSLHAADLGALFREHLGGTNFDDANNLGALTNASKQLKFESAQMEITMTNSGENKAIVEVYYIRCRKQHGKTNNVIYDCASGVYQLGFAKQMQVVDPETSEIVGVGKQNEFQVGTTPFQSPRFCSTFKILKRKKFTIAPGNSISWILKDPRNRTINAENARNQLFLPFISHGYFIQVYGVPGLEGPDPPNLTPALPTLLTIYTTRKYQYYTPVSNQDQGAAMNSI